jgi:hypothetical protein
MDYVYVLYLLLILLIIVAVLLLMSIAGKPIPFFSAKPPEDPNPTIQGGNVVSKIPNIKINDDLDDVTKGLDKSKKIYVIDGLNYIYDQYLTINKQPAAELKEENIISNYPNIAYIWKAIADLRTKYKKDHVVFIIKNQDGYKMSIYDDRLYKKWAKTYKTGIIVCYDPVLSQGAHYLKGRDDKTVCEIYDKYKNDGYDIELVSKDSYSDKANFGSIPSFKKIKYGEIPYIDT